MTTDNITAGYLLSRSLRSLGCDGLTDGEDCGCGVADLAACGGDPLRCLPARSRVTPDGIVWTAVRLVQRGGHE